MGKAGWVGGWAGGGRPAAAGWRLHPPARPDPTTPCAAYNARYPTPQDPAQLSTAPNYAGAYLNTSGDPRQFIDPPSARPNNTFYSVRLPGTHLIALSNYLPYGPGSRQLDWFRAELARVDREQTPWLIVAIHAAPLNTYGAPPGCLPLG